MSGASAFLIRHGYAVVFAAVLLNQLGIPVPAVPFLIATGVLARSGQGSAAAGFALAVAAAFAAHSVWYQAGRRGGRRILGLVCRIAIEPDACVRRTENAFARYGVKALVIAPFVPGLSAVAQPLSGMTGVPFSRFALFGIPGAALWSGTYVALGYVFGHQFLALVNDGARMGMRLAPAIALVIAAYVAWKIIQRQLFLRRLRIARIPPEELRQRLDSGERIAVVDLRHAMDIQSDPRKIPGALQISPEELEHRHAEIPRGQEIILYCT
jgi:membrane protein DedA with SNARE-associated domain